MERKEQVYDALGRINVEMILCETRDGLITNDDVKMIALAMGKGVHGVYMESVQKSDRPLEVTFRRMFDKWWLQFLHDPKNNGRQKLCQILDDVGLPALAFKVLLNSKTLDGGLNLSLPKR